MAAIFLSYVRDDEELARVVASLLERHGHSVWWDRRIKGGAQYSRAIEAALASSDFVLVLWSAASVESAWVRDEAAAGRDRGCLIPVALDQFSPPLGFRQFQTISFASWNGRGQPKNFDELVEALSGSNIGEPPKPVANVRRRASLRYWTLGAAALLATVAAVGSYLVWPGSKGSTVLIRPAPGSTASAEAANDLATRLGGMAAVTPDLRLTMDAGAADSASLILQVSATDGPKPGRDVSLLAAKDRGILWASHFEQPEERAADLAPQVSVATARVLACAAENQWGKSRALPTTVLKLYLTGCAQLPEESDTSAADLAPLFEKVVAEAQGFAPAWDKLLRAEASHVANEPGSQFTSSLRAHLEQAKKLGLDVPGIYLGEQALLRSDRFAERIAYLQRGLERHKNDPFLHQMLAIMMMNIGRRDDAISEARTASQIDPLSPALRTGYIFDLAHSGRSEDARQQLAAAERLWPGSTVVRWTRYSIEMRYGDPRAALDLVRQGVAGSGGQSETFLRARLEPTKANIDRAVLNDEELNRESPFYVSGLALTLATFGRNDEALRVLLSDRWPEYSGYQGEPLFRPPLRGVRQDPRFMLAMARMGFARYWQQSGKWPDFCFEPSLPYDCRKEAAKYL